VKALVEQLQEHAARLSRQVHDDMYRHPFWSERFGARGRQRADEDGHYHLTYLARALEGGDTQVLTRYARWLQTVLTARGMCTRHITDSFDRLGQAIKAEGWAGAELAQSYLAGASAALTYPEGTPAFHLQRASEQLAAHPLQQGPPLSSPLPAQVAEEVRTWVSCLADALVLGGSEPLGSYLRWSLGWLARQGLSAPAAQALLDALTAALQALPPEAALPAVRCLGAARQAAAEVREGVA
jgi:hypothetical protein